MSFEEILRSESRKQIIQALSNAFTMVPSLPRIVIYDAGCLLIKFLRSSYENQTTESEMVKTSQIKLLYEEVKFFVDRFHLVNHRDVSLL